MTLKKEILFTFVVIGLFGMLFFALAELYFRIFNPQLPAFLRPDPVLGTMHFSSYTVRQNNACIKAEHQLNAEGMNDIDHEVEKPEGLYRIAVIGDSYVEAMQFPLEQAYFKVMERKLREAGYSVEVLAFGVGGFGTLQEYYLLRDYALKYKPDLVILSFLTYNDIRNNSLALEKSLDMPYATIDEKGELAFPDFKLRPEYIQAFESPLRTLIFDHSHAVRYLYRLSNYSVPFRNLLAFFHLHTPAPKTDGPVKDISEEVYRVDTPDEWEKAWRVTEALIKKMKEEAEKNGAQFMLFSLSNDTQLSEDKYEQIVAKYPGVAMDPELPEKRLRAFTAEEDIVYLSALPTMKKVTEKGIEVHPACHGHWSKEASAYGGVLLSKFVTKQFLSENTKHDN